MNFDVYLVPYRPMDGLSLFQVDGCAGRKAQPVEYLSAKELPFLNNCQNSPRF